MSGLHARGSADTMVDVYSLTASVHNLQEPPGHEPQAVKPNVLHKHNRCLFSHLSITGNPALPTGGSQDKELRDCLLTIPSPHIISTHSFPDSEESRVVLERGASGAEVSPRILLDLTLLPSKQTS